MDMRDAESIQKESEQQPMKTIEVTIQPYSYKREEVQVGEIIDGEFVQKRGIWNVLKDARLTVKRTYEGKGAATNVTFSIQVPDNYPLAIAAWRLGGNVQSTSRDTHTVLLFNPEEEAAKANISSFCAALASFVEQETAKAEEVQSVEIVEESEEDKKEVEMSFEVEYEVQRFGESVQGSMWVNASDEARAVQFAGDILDQEKEDEDELLLSCQVVASREAA